MKWEIVPRDEQETLINVDYCEKKIIIYTSRKATGDRLLKKIGEPTKIDYNNGLVSGITYERNLFDKDVAKFFSKGLIIGAFRENNVEDNKIVEERGN
jgi:hypothetical protein